jgi:hypothetical protein
MKIKLSDKPMKALCNPLTVVSFEELVSYRLGVEASFIGNESRWIGWERGSLRGLFE